MAGQIKLLTILVVVVFGADRAAPPATLTREPYLQLQTPTSVHVVWLTDTDTTGEVEWGLTSSYGNLETSLAPSSRQEVAITGLAPDTLYHYRVRSDGIPLSSDATFRTAPSSGASAVSFTVQGDSRSAPSNCEMIFNAMLPETQNGFCLSLGDLPGRGEDNITDYWQLHFFNPAANFIKHMSLYPCIGNHEVYDENSYPNYVYPTKYLDIWSLPTENSGNEFYYSFDKGDVHFTCLDVYWSSYTMGSTQYNWLQSDLAATTKNWKVVFMHNGPYVSQNGGANGSSTIRSTLVPVFESAGVDLVLYGHYHDYQRNQVNGVAYLLQGCGGASLNGTVDDSQPYVQAYASEFCFTRLDVDGNTVLGRTMKASGTVLDGFRIDKAPVGFPWQDSFPGGAPDLDWIAPWNYSSQCGVVAQAGNPSGDGYVFEVADTIGHQYAYPMLANESLADYSIEAQVYYDNSSPVTNRFGIGVRGRGFFSSSERSHYALTFVDNETLADDGHCVLMLREAGAETVLADWAYPDVSGWHRMKLSVSGNTLHAWIDDELKTTTPVFNGALPKGRPFLYNYRASDSGLKTLADDVVVTVAAESPSGQHALDDFEAYAEGTYAVFRHPSYSGSTWGVEPGSAATVSTEEANDTLGAIVGPPGAKCDKITWNWTSPGTGYIRLTTSNTTNRPNPLLDLSKGLSLYLKLPAGLLDAQLQIRETGGSGPIGADGGTTGGIERTANPVRVRSGDCWQYVHFDIPNEAWTAFTGDGILNGDWGTLESLAISPVAGDPTTAYTLYLDDMYQGQEQSPLSEDCNSNGIPDACDLSEATSMDCNNNAAPDECDAIGGGDFDGDGVVDLTDLVAITECLTGPAATPSPPQPECVSMCLDAFDFDDDDDVDLQDFGRFQRAFMDS